MCRVSAHEDRKVTASGMIEHAFLATTTAFEALDSNVQFAVLVAGVFLFFGIHNYLQEAIMAVPDFSSSIMLGYFEVLGVTVCSFVERHYVVKETGRKSPLSVYPSLTFCLLSSSALSNMSLSYINFPTKVVFRSCKLIPTMIISTLFHNRMFTSLEYVCAMAACTGLIMFTAADFDESPQFHSIGLTLVSLSVCADAVLPNAQERVFRKGSSRLEVTLYTNVFTLLIMTISTFLSGDLIGVLSQMKESRQLQMYFMIYTFVAYVAISFHMNVVMRYGGVAAVLIATGRKAMTLILSFLLFPKEISWLHPAGAAFVLGSLLVASLAKVKKKVKKSKSDLPLSLEAQPLSGTEKHTNGDDTSTGSKRREATRD